MLEVPESSPVAELKLVHHGLLVIENVSLLPAGLVVDGLNSYARVSTILVAGLPLIVGAVAALASGEDSDEARTSAHSAARRGHTAAVEKMDIVTTPCGNPTWFARGSKHARCVSSASRAAQIVCRYNAARWRLRSGSPAV